ncbi:ABC transporter substrate-binding protein [Paenibacillus lentus]|uniref:Carbohydrate ABC transporter substrate-binding protein n=1 Tax=Paenibacillus lentus TaxID=1338368 RepID=A0A3S8RQ81_9BACL|nr:ABC transporter substrate-binding protein [Paenibacillus lentus]AZK45116.1 carbohydrate ABC transporter substrate-binding protein [Paenibacillus lentus]
MKKLCLLLSLLILLPGCQVQVEEHEHRTLKVLAFNERTFNQLYGNFFLATHSNYSIEVVSIFEHLTPGTNMTDTIEELIAMENIDLITIPMESYSVLQETGKLLSLDEMIIKDRFDLTNYSPAVLDFLQDEQGKIHGLTPTFVGEALFYNKELFDEYRISYPRDLITWEEVFALAHKFSDFKDGQTPQFGFYHKKAANPFMMALTIGEGSGLSVYGNGKFTLNSSSWEKIFDEVTSCFKSGTCFDPNQVEQTESLNIEDVTKKSYPFLSGNIAMAVADSSLYRILDEENNELEWGITTLPIRAEQPNMGNGITMNDIFSIPSNNDDTKGAWEFIKYVSGNDYARLLPQINTMDLPVRVAENQEESIKAFYKLEKVNHTLVNEFRELPSEIYPKIDEISARYLAEMLSEQRTVQESLQLMEEELQVTLESMMK